MQNSKSAVVLTLCVSLVLGVKWDQENDPSGWNSSLLYKLDKLPASAASPKIPWSDTYWPSYKGGIANRWQDDSHGNPGFKYKLYTLEELKSGKIDLDILSPAEKFDIFNSRYDYPLLNSEWQRCSPNDASWEGICHGWAPASIQYEQPNNVTLKNKDGLEIPFGSSDVKALLSYFLAQFAQGQEKTLFISQRCNTDIKKNPTKANAPECWDINPGSFHVMMTNMIGLAGKAFVCDIDRSIEVWNQPMAKYEYTLGTPGKPLNNSAPGTVTTQPVTFTLYYVKETYPSAIAHDSLILNERYQYILDLDANGNVLGGSYEDDQWDRVDFMWGEVDLIAFYGYFAQLDTIYKASIGGSMTTRMATKGRRVRLADYRALPVMTGRISLTSYDDQTRRSWLVSADSGSSVPRRLIFKSFNTRRHTDYVRIFEVENGQVGAPIAVLHGSSLPNDIILRPGVSALITFGVDPMAARRMSSITGTGFEIVVL